VSTVFAKVKPEWGFGCFRGPWPLMGQP